MSVGRERPAGALVLGPGEGRAYEMGSMRAVFKADGAETGDRYAVSEWWIEPRSDGPDPHSQDSDELFYVIQGTVSVLLGEEWIEARKGSFLRIPAGVTHSFANRTDAPAGLLDFKVPGGFETEMPGIAEWFRERDR